MIYTGKSYIHQLATDYSPEIRYDPQENYFADSAAELTDNVHTVGDQTTPNALLQTLGFDHPDRAIVATADGSIGDKLSLDYLGTRKASVDDRIDEAGDKPEHLADARALHTNPLYGDRIYERTVKDSDNNILWLQYWMWYYYNDPDSGTLGDTGNHEGDWELVQYGLDPDSLAPKYAMYDQHGATEKCPWSGVEISPASGRPIVYSAAGSHASYFHAGAHDRPFPLPAEAVRDDGPRATPQLDYWGSSPPAWVSWTGRWGGDRVVVAPVVGPIPILDVAAPNSPVGPSHQAHWDPKEAFAHASTCQQATARRSPRASRTKSQDVASRLLNLHASPRVTRVTYGAASGQDRELWITTPGDNGSWSQTYKYDLKPGAKTATLRNLPEGSRFIWASVVFADGTRSPLVKFAVPLDNS